MDKLVVCKGDVNAAVYKTQVCGRYLYVGFQPLDGNAMSKRTKRCNVNFIVADKSITERQFANDGFYSFNGMDATFGGTKGKFLHDVERIIKEAAQKYPKCVFEVCAIDAKLYGIYKAYLEPAGFEDVNGWHLRFPATQPKGV